MPDIRICTLVSGSSGNAIYAQSKEGAILIDAGVSGRAITQAIEAVGSSIDHVDGLILTHCHSDHCQGAGVLARKYDIPLFMTAGAHNGCLHRIGRSVRPRIFRPGSMVAMGGFHIHTLQTPHDSPESVALILESGGVRCGVLTDLGCLFGELIDIMPTLDAVVLESNYDPHMLATGPYPKRLKERITADHGHISNQEAASLVCDNCNGRLKAIILAHLSETNNNPEIAYECMQQALAQTGKEKVKLLVAPRYTPSPMLHLHHTLQPEQPSN